MPKPKNKRRIGYLGRDPMIRLAGKYLSAYGFKIGEPYLVEYQTGHIAISVEKTTLSR